MLDTATVETFEPYVGETFYLQVSETEKLAVVLIAAEKIGKGDARFQRAPFSLLFRPPTGLVLHQQTYRMTHDKLDTLDIFLVPVQPDVAGPLLEAVFT